MEIFSEIKNSSVRIIIQAINNYFTNNTPIYEEELIKKLRGNLLLRASDAETMLLKQLFHKSKTTPVVLEPRVKSCIPIIPTALELQWLYELVNDPRMSGFLDPNLRSKLLSKINNQTISDSYWTQINWNNLNLPQHNYYDDPKYINTFHLCLKALTEQRQVVYKSHNNNGNSYQEKVSPYKIEFSVNTNSFNFIFWDDEKQQTNKTDIANITELTLLNTSIPSDVISKANMYVELMKKDNEPIVIRLTNTYEALERCFLLLSSYDKKISRQDENTFILEIFHRGHFDEEDLTQIILSLGKSVTVINPPIFREKIINLIKESFTR